MAYDEMTFKNFPLVERERLIKEAQHQSTESRHRSRGAEVKLIELGQQLAQLQNTSAAVEKSGLSLDVKSWYEFTVKEVETSITREHDAFETSRRLYREWQDQAFQYAGWNQDMA